MRRSTFWVCILAAGLLLGGGGARGGGMPVFDYVAFIQSLVNNYKEVEATLDVLRQGVENAAQVQKIVDETARVAESVQEIKGKVKLGTDARACLSAGAEMAGMVGEMAQELGRFRGEDLSAAEYAGLAKGYRRFVELCVEETEKLSDIINPGLEMNDAERLSRLAAIRRQLEEYRALMRYYHRKNLSLVRVRRENRDHREAVRSLYGSGSSRYW